MSSRGGQSSHSDKHGGKGHSSRDKHGGVLRHVSADDEDGYMNGITVLDPGRKAGGGEEQREAEAELEEVNEVQAKLNDVIDKTWQAPDGG